MAEISRPWPGTTVGDAGPYTAPSWWDVWQALADGSGAISGVGNKGVFHNVGEALRVTYIGPNVVSVGTGAALVDGLFYHNNQAKSISVGSAASGRVRDDRIVLRKYFNAAIQNARIILVSGSDAVAPGPGTPTALQQDVNRLANWDIPLARLTIDASGTITVKDEREFLPPTSTGLVHLSTIEVTAAAGSQLSFRDIPQQYSDLVLTYVAQAASVGLTSAGVALSVNDDAQASHYFSTYQQYNYEALSIGTHYSQSLPYWIIGQVDDGDSGAANFSTGEATLSDYASSRIHVARGHSNQSDPRYSYQAVHCVYDPKYTPALPYVGIHKISLRTDYAGGSGNFNFMPGSIFRLYARVK